MLKTESLNELNVQNGDIEWIKKYYENVNTLAFENEIQIRVRSY